MYIDQSVNLDLDRAMHIFTSNQVCFQALRSIALLLLHQLKHAAKTDHSFHDISLFAALRFSGYSQTLFPQPEARPVGVGYGAAFRYWGLRSRTKLEKRRPRSVRCVKLEQYLRHALKLSLAQAGQAALPSIFGLDY